MSGIAQLLSVIASGKGAKFASLTYRTESTGEVARYSLILGASTEVLYRKDIAMLTEMLAGDMEPMMRAAAEKVLMSRQKSLDVGIGNNPAYTCADTYFQDSGIKGVKVHKDTGTIYVTALAEGKVVLVEGAPRKAVNSKPETIAKAKVEKLLPSARFRQFKLNTVSRAALNNEVLELVCA